jgi:hypothetical protein
VQRPALRILLSQARHNHARNWSSSVATIACLTCYCFAKTESLLVALKSKEVIKMIQEFHKGVEIELEIHQLQQGFWKCDYTLITHPGRSKTIHHGDREFETMDLAKEYALQEAREAIDRNSEGQPEEEFSNPPREVRIKPYPG